MTSLSQEQERLFRRLHSAAGALPVGAFFLAHVWINARAMQGDRAYGELAVRLGQFPAMTAIEAIFVWLPLAFHAGYGVWMVAQVPARKARGPTDKPWGARLQRLTGAITLVFLVVHLFEFRVPVALGSATHEDLFPLLCDQLSTTTSAGIPLNAALYLTGVAACSYHFANGILGFSFTFAWATRVRRVQLLTACAAGLGLGAFLVAANTVIFFATGAAWPGEGEPRTPADGVGTIRTSAGTHDSSR